MKILIASDIHGATDRTEVLVDKIAALGPGLVLLLGDLLYHGPRNKLPGGYDGPDTAELLHSIETPVIAVRGNCDAEVDQLMLPWTLVETSCLDLDGHLFLAVHGHQLPINGGHWEVSPGFNLLFGHTHLPLAERRDETRLWNPGSLGIPKGGNPPSYGWYQDGVFQVRALNDEVIAQDSFRGW
ncbi:MAG: phosphodiesterase [Deltaproteobacteria bacterium]|nr:phosphodiesterase [Deltaproteobacteria bacterium]